MTKRVIEREQSIMGTIFFIFKVNTVEKVLRDFFQLSYGEEMVQSQALQVKYMLTPKLSDLR